MTAVDHVRATLLTPPRRLGVTNVRLVVNPGSRAGRRALAPVVDALASALTAFTNAPPIRRQLRERAVA